MREINRVSIVVRPKPQFLHWLQSLSDADQDSLEPWCSVYLVAASENEQPEKTLAKHFDPIFVEQLEGWHNLPDDWPRNRTFRLFKEWFDAEVCDVVFDLSTEKPFRYDD